MRKAGVLMPVSALPSRIGAGELGESAFQFIELLKENHVKIWQILPLNPVGYGNSPYQPYSSCAGDELYISLDALAEEGLLKEHPKEFQERATRVDYEAVRQYREPFLRTAFDVFTEKKGQEETAYKEFASQEWVYEYGVFRALKKTNNGECWNDWPEEYRTWPENRQKLPAEVETEAQYQMFLQYIFYTQWMKVKKAANDAGIQIMGDVPFYVGQDSVDVWGGKDNFLLDTDGRPIFIAGVPPDYFSATGQRWGNPIYDWEHMKEQDYRFWVDRIGYSNKLFDIIRIDHFRAFDTYWKIPADCPTAIDGEWIEAPGYEVIDTLQKVREVGGDNYSYANDYQIMARLKNFAEAHGICLLLVHHTRKQNADDKFDMISGTSGLLGAADGAFLLQKEKRTGNAATLEVSGRDQQDQKLYLIRNTETLLWDLQKAETELWKEPPEPLLDEIAELVMKDNPYGEGSPTALVALINVDIQPHVITRKLNVLAGRLYAEHRILFRSERVHEGRKLRLWKDNTENA